MAHRLNRDGLPSSRQWSPLSGRWVRRAWVNRPAVPCGPSDDVASLCILCGSSYWKHSTNSSAPMMRNVQVLPGLFSSTADAVLSQRGLTVAARGALRSTTTTYNILRARLSQMAKSRLRERVGDGRPSSRLLIAGQILRSEPDRATATTHAVVIDSAIPHHVVERTFSTSKPARCLSHCQPACCR